MAHHQGMILLSLVNYLHDNIMVRRFHADPIVRSVELLLQEKVPYDAPLEVVQPEDMRATRQIPFGTGQRFAVECAGAVARASGSFPVEWALRRADYERGGWL